MEYGDDPRFFTQDLEPQLEALLIDLLVMGHGDFNASLDADGNRLSWMIMLWAAEADCRLAGDEPSITQFEFAYITRGLLAYADYLGLYCPRVGEFFVSVTDNPLATPRDQEPAAATDSGENLLALANVELDRIAMASGVVTPRRKVVATGYTPGDCPECGGPNTKVASSPARFRRLLCKDCGHRWKESR